MKKAFQFMNIRVATIAMNPPMPLSDWASERKPVISHPTTDALIEQENQLRKSAYSTTSIVTGDSFFDDSDMRSGYYLIVVYDKTSATALLSARYYFDKTVIAKYLNGAGNDPHNVTLKLHRFGENELFLIDRLSANLHSSVYRRNRQYIHLMLYSRLISCHKGCKFIAMARRERSEKLLASYLRLGLRIIGMKVHQGKEHWILFCDMDKHHAQLRRSMLMSIALIAKYIFTRRRPG